MNILCVLNSLGSGGAERQMSYLSSLLAKDGHEVTLCYYAKNNFNRSFIDDKVKLKYIPKTSRWALYKSLSNLINNTNADVVIAYLLTPSFYSAIAKVLSFRPKTKLIVSERNFNIHGLKLSDYLIRIPIFVVANAIVCNSQKQMHLLQSRFPLYKHKICYIGNALDLNLYQPKSHFIDEGIFKLILPASFIPSKNHLGLAKAVLLLKEKRQLYVEVHCFGSNIDHIINGKKYISPTYNELKEFIITNKLSSNIILHEPVQNLYQLYNQFDGLILPSFYEGCPNAVMEGMASGLPILASNVSDVSFLTEGAKGGMLFNPQNIEAIAETINSFCRLSNEERRSMSSHNLKRAEDLFNFKVFLNKYYSVMHYSHE